MTSLILQNNERFYSLSRLVVVALTPFFCHQGKPSSCLRIDHGRSNSSLGWTTSQNPIRQMYTDKASEREFHFSCGFFQTDVLVYRNWSIPFGMNSMKPRLWGYDVRLSVLAEPNSREALLMNALRLVLCSWWASTTGWKKALKWAMPNE